MALQIITWLISAGLHGAFAIAMLMPASGHVALEEGTGDDIMVVEQGIALQGVARLGEDMITMDQILAPPVVAAAQPLEQIEAVEEQPELPVEDVEEVKPVQDVLVASDSGPEDENFAEPEEIVEVEPEEMKEAKREELKETEEPELKEQPLPQQVATVVQETVIAMRESTGEEQRGGSTTEHRKYLGALRDHLERSKVNPRTTQAGTAIIHLIVKSDGSLLEHKIVKSSGSKVLDNAALASIAKAAPFPPIPTDVGREIVEVDVPFKFLVR